MAAITAALVKSLREATGAGMMDCKKALTETDGDVDAATDWLRTKGLAAAAKKAGRTASEGLVGVTTAGTVGAVVEMNAETDFVARNDKFQAFVTDLSKLALDTKGDLEALKAATFPDAEGRTVDGQVTHMIATIGENMTLRRSAGLSVEAGVIGSYIHNSVAPGLGKIGVLVGLSSTGDADKLEAFAKQLAMHVAAATPLFATIAEVDPDALAREREVQTAKAKESGKPDNIVEKMVEGRLRKYYEEVVLLEQVSMIDGETKISKQIDALAKEVGAPVELAGFVRFQLGDGVEKEEEDFASEVAKQLSK
ncbi:MAG: translation elongation factor Ts [Rhodospirillaceae bacterium]